MTRPMMPFVYAPMRLKGELLRKHPDDVTKTPVFDLVLGPQDDWPQFPEWTQNAFGDIRKGDATLGAGRFLYKLHDVVAVQGGVVGPHAWYIALEPGVCALEASPRGRRDVPGTEGLMVDLGERGKVGINLMPTYEVTHHETEPTVFHAHGWENNYFHRVIDSLPRGWAEEEALVPADARWVHRDKVAVHYDTLYFPSFWPSAGYSDQPIHWLRKRLKKNPTRDRRGLLYLSRSDATKRRVLNEDEVVAALSSMGWNVTWRSMKGLSLEQQVELAERAEVIVGPHGAAMTNAIFGTEATVVEFVPARYQHPVYGYLSKWSGHRYCRIICDGDIGSDLTVSIEALHEATRW